MSSGALTLALVSLVGGVTERATFIFELNEVPVGSVELERSDSPPTFRYRSIHWFPRDQARAPAHRSATLPLDAKGFLSGTSRLPAALWVWRRPARGCLMVRDELSGKEGDACAEEVWARSVRGVWLGQPFQAGYDAAGVLDRLQLGSAEFVRVAAAAPPLEGAAKDVFDTEVPVPAGRGTLALDPPLVPAQTALAPWSEAEARALADAVLRSFADDRPGEVDLAEDPRSGTRGGCLGHARRFVALAGAVHGVPRAEVLLGFYVSPGGTRARAHAWVRVKVPGGAALQLDPTLGVPVGRSTHVALGTPGPIRETGSVYLSVYRGERRIVRTPATAP